MAGVEFDILLLCKLQPLKLMKFICDVALHESDSPNGASALCYDMRRLSFVVHPSQSEGLVYLKNGLT